MKTKYITTDKHPALKCSLDLKLIGDRYEFILGHKTFYAGQQCIDFWSSQGYIKEVEELEFTKSDMIELIKYVSKFDYGTRIKSYDDFLNNWLKQRNK